MEFRYRAVDGDRPPTATEPTPSQSTNPDVPFLTARPMLGCNRGTSDEDHVRAGIQREIEKEQIRQEIIAAETGRRRELIAEVMQEMAMERVMAIRRVAEMGMTQNEKLPTQNHNIDPLMYTSPYTLATSHEAIGAKATSMMESNKDKFIVLDRVEAIGAKRKAEEAPSEDGVGLNEDLQGESDKAKESEPKSVEVEKTAPSKRPCSAKRYKFWCDICGVGTFSQIVMRNHELGRKHMAAVKQHDEPSENSSTTVQKVDDMAEKETEGEKKKKVTFTCETCNIQTYSEKVMETHKLGKKHKALLEKLHKKPISVLDTNLITVPVSSLNVDLGEKGDKK